MAGLTTEVSEPDSKTFGFTFVRAGNVTRADIPTVLDYSRRHGARVLVVRCATSSIETVQALEDEGFRLADTLVYSRAEFDNLNIPERRLAFPIRPFRFADNDQIVEVARVLYANYFGHYHADPMFDRAKVDEAYVDWSRRSCVDKTVAEEIFVIDDNGRIGGYVTMRLNDAEDGEMVVGGVHPDYGGKGLYRDFLITGVEWCLAKGRIRMVVSTQVNNFTVQRAWAQLGFRPWQSFYTLHKWF